MMKLFQFAKNNVVTIFLGLCVIGTAFTLMIVSQEVYERQKKVNGLSRDVLQAQWDIKSLNAELSYLSRPERVEQISTAMAQTHSSGMQSPMVNKVISPVSLQFTAPVVPVQKPFMKASVKRTAAQTTSKPKTVHKKAEVQKTPPVVENKQPEKNFALLLDDIGGVE